MIKLDVQGAEIDILQGLQDNLSLFEVVILEVSLRELNQGSPLFPEVCDFMKQKKNGPRAPKRPRTACVLS